MARWGQLTAMAADSNCARMAFEADLRPREHYLALVFNSAQDMMLLGKVEPDMLFRIVSVNRPYVDTSRHHCASRSSRSSGSVTIARLPSRARGQSFSGRSQ